LANRKKPAEEIAKGITLPQSIAPGNAATHRMFNPDSAVARDMKREAQPFRSKVSAES
jgi:hypothetical protein